MCYRSLQYNVPYSKLNAYHLQFVHKFTQNNSDILWSIGNNFEVHFNCKQHADKKLQKTVQDLYAMLVCTTIGFR